MIWGITIPKCWSIVHYTVSDLYAELGRTLRVVSNPPHTVIMIAVAVGDVQLSAHLLLGTIYLQWEQPT